MKEIQKPSVDPVSFDSLVQPIYEIHRISRIYSLWMYVGLLNNFGNL